MFANPMPLPDYVVYERSLIVRHAGYSVAQIKYNFGGFRRLRTFSGGPGQAVN
jgi:hypothetical protein